MPRDATQELNFISLTASPAGITGAGALVPGLAAIAYEVEQIQDPIEAILFIPSLSMSVGTATLTVSIQDVTGAAQTLQTVPFLFSGAVTTGPLIVVARFLPQNLTVTPTLAGPRLLGVFATASANTATLNASATAPITFQILDLARQ